MERHPVPQNLMDVEFKLFGALTIRQFAYLAGGCLLGVMFYFSSIPSILKIIFVGLSVGTGFFLSLVKINGQPSTVWLSNFLISLIVPQERLWRKTASVPEILKNDQSLKVKTDKDVVRILSLPAKINNIHDISGEQENKKDKEVEEEEKSQLQKIDEHFNFLFDKLPNIPTTPVNTNKPGEFTKEKTEIKPEDLPITPREDTIALKTSPEDSKGDVVYKTDSYVAKVKPIESEVNRPLSKVSQIVNNNYIKGIVENKLKQPIANAKISFLDFNNQLVKTVTSGSSGVFFTETPLKSGQYYVDTVCEGYKFNRGIIKLSGEKEYLFKITSIN